MIRILLYLVLAIFVITILRMIIGVVARGAGELLGGGAGSRVRGGGEVSPGGDLKRDPVCGTYVSAASSVKKSVSGQVLHFCSESCRDKYSG